MRFILFNAKLTFKINYFVIMLLIVSIAVSVFGISLVYGIAMTSYETHENDELILSIKINDDKKWTNISFAQKHITHSSGTLKYKYEKVYYGEEESFKIHYDVANIIFSSDNPNIQKKIDEKQKIIWVPSVQKTNIQIGDTVTINNSIYEVVGYSSHFQYAVDIPFYSDLVEWRDSDIYISLSGVVSQANKYTLLNDLGAKQVPHSTGGYVAYLIMTVSLVALAFFLIGKLFQKMIANSLPTINIFRMLGANNLMSFISLFVGSFIYLLIGIMLGVLFSIKYVSTFLKTIIIHLYPTDFWIISVLISLSAIATFVLALITILKKSIKGTSGL